MTGKPPGTGSQRRPTGASSGVLASRRGGTAAASSTPLRTPGRPLSAYHLQSGDLRGTTLPSPPAVPAPTIQSSIKNKQGPESWSAGRQAPGRETGLSRHAEGLNPHAAVTHHHTKTAAGSCLDAAGEAGSKHSRGRQISQAGQGASTVAAAAAGGLASMPRVTLLK